MEITQINFKEKLPDILETIQKANFFVIDNEFTGISSEYSINPFDTPEDYYLKTIKDSDGFIIVQFGLSAFWVHPDDETKFQYKSYNFYVYPRRREQCFKCEGESLSFLSRFDFDFNKLFREGISFCNTAEAEKLKDQMVKRQQQRSDIANFDEPDLSNHVPVPDEEKATLELICEEIENFLKGDNAKEYVVANLNSFQRKLLYQTMETKFFRQISISTRTLENNMRAIVIEKRKSLEEEQEIEKAKVQDENDKLMESIGMTLIMQALSESKKLLIGHNMLLDLVYLLRQFFAPLPENCLEFKKFAHSIFPNLLDTKYLSWLDRFKTKIKSSVLRHLYDTVKQEPFIIPKVEPVSEEYSYSKENAKEHEAGYDSFITGICFLSLINDMKIEPNKTCARCPQLKNYLNKIFLLRLQDVHHFNLTGHEPKPSRDHVFYISFPKTWKQSDIVNQFKDFGSIYIKWLNDTSAMVALHQKEYSKYVLKRIGIASGFKLQTFADYKNETFEKSVASDLISMPSLPKNSMGNSKTKKRKHHNANEFLSSNADATGEKLFKENDDWTKV